MLIFCYKNIIDQAFEIYDHFETRQVFIYNLQAVGTIYSFG